MRRTLSAIALSLFLTVAATAEPFTTVGLGMRQTAEVFDYATLYPGATTGTFTVEYNEAYARRHGDAYFVELAGFTAPEQKHYRFFDSTANTEYYTDIEATGWQVTAGPKFEVAGLGGVRLMPLLGYEWTEYTDTRYVTTVSDQTVTTETYTVSGLSVDVALMKEFAPGGYVTAGLELFTDVLDPGRERHDVWVDAMATVKHVTLTGRATYQLSPPPGYDRVMSFEGGIGVGW